MPGGCIRVPILPSDHQFYRQIAEGAMRRHAANPEAYWGAGAGRGRGARAGALGVRARGQGAVAQRLQPPSLGASKMIKRFICESQ
jgi:hypothetical protein